MRPSRPVHLLDTTQGGGENPQLTIWGGHYMAMCLGYRARWRMRWKSWWVVGVEGVLVGWEGGQEYYSSSSSVGLGAEI